MPFVLPKIRTVVIHLRVVSCLAAMFLLASCASGQALNHSQSDVGHGRCKPQGRCGQSLSSGVTMAPSLTFASRISKVGSVP